MFTFLLQITMVVCLGLIVYLFGRVVPRISDADVEKAREQSLFHWLVGYFEKIDEWLIDLFEKFLRRFHIVILKIDNVITKKIGRFRREAEKQTGFDIDAKKSDSEHETGK